MAAVFPDVLALVAELLLGSPQGAGAVHQTYVLDGAVQLDPVGAQVTSKSHLLPVAELPVEVEALVGHQVGRVRAPAVAFEGPGRIRRLAHPALRPLAVAVGGPVPVPTVSTHAHLQALDLLPRPHGYISSP